MYYFILALIIWNPAVALDTAQNSSLNYSMKVHQAEEDERTLTLKKTEELGIANKSSSSSLSSSTKSDLLSSQPKNITEESLSKNISQINLENPSPNTSVKESAHIHNTTINTKKVVTEGGNSVSTLGNSVTNFQNSRVSPSKVKLTEGGDQGIISDKVDSVSPKPNVTQILSNNRNSSKSQNTDDISSMNKGKIAARKGVNDPKQMNSPFEDYSQVVNTSLMTHPPPTILKDKEPIQTVSTNTSHVRMAKPLVTDDRSESSVNRISKVDYIVPIVCTAFSVPLLIVLAVYLYKKGKDFWERRHYNRMDFLIEGIYNE